MPTEYHLTLTVQHHECGEGSVLKLKDLLDYLQDAAGNHADLLGVGLADLHQRKALWVLSRLKLELTRDLKLGEKLELTTYPSGVDLLFATRQFTLRDAEGMVVMRGTSYWLVLDAADFRPLRPSEHLPSVLLDRDGVECHFTDLGKIRRVECAMTPLRSEVRRTDIDENGHLNNAQYGRYITDAVSALLDNADVRIRSVQINYNHQARLGDVIDCAAVRQADGSIYMEGRTPDGKSVYFQAVCGLA